MGSNLVLVISENLAIRVRRVFTSGILSKPIILSSSPDGKLSIPESVFILNKASMARDKKILLVG